MLWLNGGPGCSSIASGLLFEHGPCAVKPGGNDTVHNPHSWNEHVNIIYLDEPIGTGYSYASDGSTVDTLADLAADVYAFMSLFLKRYPQYALAPFHVAAESWGGHYGPHVVSYIYQQNQAFVYYPRKGMVYINLASLIIANGLTEPYSQFESIPDYKCGGAPYPYLDPSSWTCRTMKANKPVCLGLISACYRSKTKAACTAATAHCWPALMSGSKDNNTTLRLLAADLSNSTTDETVNQYDIRMPCEAGSQLCYAELDDAAKWMNKLSVRQVLGADTHREFLTCNSTVNSGFYLQGQAMINSAELLPKLLGHGIRLLVYAGDVGG